MSCYYLAPSETKVSIPSFDTVDSVEYFLIRVTCWNNKEWTVSSSLIDVIVLIE